MLVPARHARRHAAAAPRFVLVATPIVLATAFVGLCHAVPPGLADLGQAGHAVKCQKMLDKGTAKYLATWSKTYANCIGGIASCVQTKASDANCLTKAVASCNKLIPKLSDDTDKDAGTVLENLGTSFCGSLTLAAQLDDPGGPLFSLLADDCKNRFGIPSLSSGIGSIMFCFFRETNCAAESMLLAQQPRARHFLDDAGIVIGNAVGPRSCLLDVGGAGSLGDGKAGKALLKCQKGAAKASATFAGKSRGAFAKCAEAVFTCAQLKPDQKCIDGATKTCTKQLANVDAAQTKLGDTVTKTCAVIPPGDLRGPAGGDVDGLATVCSALGVSTLTTVADYASCLERQTRCQVEESVRFTSPRIGELFTAVGQTFGSAFCPTS